MTKQEEDKFEMRAEYDFSRDSQPLRSAFSRVEPGVA
jgi:hypothetical protein